MSPRRLLACFVLIASCGGAKSSTPGPAQAIEPSAVAQPRPPATGRDAPLPLWSAVKKGMLSNGLTYYIMKHGKPEKRALLWLAVNAGSVLEDDDQRGLAHFDEHMAFNGTKRFPKAEVVNYLQSIGMRFGPDLNAYTNFDQTVYQLEVPTDSPAFIDKGLDILRDWAGNISFDPAEVEKERGVVLEEWRLGQNAGRRIFDKQAKVLFEGTRYADRLTIGLPETLKKAPRDALVRFYKDWYRPDLMAVIAVGDVDPAAIEAQIKARFGDLQRAAKSRPRIAGGVPKANGTRVSIDTDRELPGVRVSVHNLVRHRPEASAKDFRRIIVEQLYGLMLNERLSTIGRRPESPFIFANVGVDDMTRDIDTFRRFAQVKNGKVEDTLKALFTEVVRVERHGFTQAELDRARTNFDRGYEQAVTDAATTDGHEYIDEITRNFFEGELMTGRAAEYELVKSFLPTITLDEVRALVTSFGGAENRVITIAGPEGAKAVPLPTRERVLAIIGEVERNAIEPWKDIAVPTTLMKTPPAPGKVAKESRVDPIGVTVWTLSNGARVIVKPTNFVADEVVILGESPGGQAMASDKEFGNARFADDIASIGGVGELDAEALRKVLTGKHLNVGASVERTTESVEASGSARDLETMFQLIHLRMTAPRKDNEAFTVWRANSAEQLTNLERDPGFKFQRESNDVLYKGHRRAKLFPLPAEIEKVDQDKALAFYRNRFGDATDFTFVIVGNIELTKLKPLVETYLASLPAKGRKEKEKDVGVRKIGGAVKKSWKLGQDQRASVSITFHGEEPWTRDKDRDLYILSQVLSIRLREVMREDMGGVYGVGVRGSFDRSPRPERSLFVRFECDPAQVDKLIAAVFDESAKLAREGIDGSYIEKVKQQYLRVRELQLRDNEFWESWLATSYRYGDDPTLVLDPSKMIARMTSENIKAAAKRYLDPKRYYQAVKLPEAGAAPAAPPSPTSPPPAPTKPVPAPTKPAPAPTKPS